MLFGLANTPATFQELMNQINVIRNCRLKVQELQRRGALIEAYIDDVFLGSNTTKDRTALIDEFLAICDGSFLVLDYKQQDFTLMGCA